MNVFCLCPRGFSHSGVFCTNAISSEVVTIERDFVKNPERQWVAVTRPSLKSPSEFTFLYSTAESPVWLEKKWPNLEKSGPKCAKNDPSLNPAVIQQHDLPLIRQLEPIS